MPTDVPTWEEHARRQLKAELKRTTLSCSELAIRLRQYGFDETEASIVCKLCGNSFGEGFFRAALAALESPFREDPSLR
jgi:Domain of unknown function (DUF6471)